MRVGLGYDVHKLVKGKKLIIGGVDIPYGKGLLGHSDADVLLHAVKDSILGAAALGDIGKHFPDTNQRYKDADSLELLRKINILINSKGYTVNNLDTIIFAQKPKMAPYIEQMKNNIALALNIEVERINIKATTTEGLGFIGKGEGIAASSIASIVRNG